MSKLLSSVLLILAASGCSIVSFEELEISCYPNERDAVIADEESIEFTISPAPDRESLEQIFSLKLQDQTIPGDFSWDENSFSFRPLEGWRWGERYRYSFDGELKTAGNLEFVVKKTNTFYVEMNDGPLMISGFTPQNEAITDVYSPVGITFNRPVNPESFQLEFSTIPETPYTVTWDAANVTATIEPDEKWKVNTRYNWKISDSLRGASGQYILREQSYYFTTSADSVLDEDIQLQLASYSKGTNSYTIPGIDLNEVTTAYQMLFLFAEPVNTADFSNSYSIEPSLSHDLIILSPTEVILYPNETYTPEETYTITLDTTLADTSGNTLQEEISWEMTCSNIHYQEIESISAQGGHILYGAGETDAPITLLATGEDIFQRFTITFREPISDPDTQYQLVQNDIVFNGFFPASVFPPERVLLNWNNNRELELQYKDFVYSPDIAGNQIHYYSILIKGGTEATRTSEGAYLKEDRIIYFHVGEGP